ncbi:MAG: hypothetical protein ACSHX0_13215 [Akkermansiaceae bacterium]
MKVTKYKECPRCRGYGAVGDPIGAMDICPECGGKKQVSYREYQPPQPSVPPAPKEDMNWWWFLIGGVFTFLAIQKFDMQSVIFKWIIILSGGCILGAWWKQLFIGFFICVALLLLMVWTN